MSLPHPDTCSFCGIGRPELLSRGAVLHGVGPAFICSWCVETAASVLRESSADTKVVECSFCGATARGVAGPTIAACVDCVTKWEVER